MYDDPLSSLTTAYQLLEEKIYRAEIEITDRYQNFTAELLRLALLGIGAFGFLYKEVFFDFDVTKHPNINIELAKIFASISLFLFGITSVFALIFRYCSSEGLRTYLEGLRYIQAGLITRGEKKLKERKIFLFACILSKAIAAFSLAIGALMTALTFLKLLN